MMWECKLESLTQDSVQLWAVVNTAILCWGLKEAESLLPIWASIHFSSRFLLFVVNKSVSALMYNNSFLIEEIFHEILCSLIAIKRVKIPFD